MATQWSKPSPPGWPRISSALVYRDPARAIDWLCRAFGFEVRLKVAADDGSIVHSELTIGDGLIMVAGEGAKWNVPARSPQSLGGANTQTLFTYVDDVQAHHDRAVAAGARIVRELATSDYGEDYWSDRGYAALDLEGHNWSFAQRLSGPKA